MASPARAPISGEAAAPRLSNDLKVLLALAAQLLALAMSYGGLNERVTELHEQVGEIRRLLINDRLAK